MTDDVLPNELKDVSTSVVAKLLNAMERENDQEM